MPKPKSHKGLLKRIRITGTGKVKHKKSGRTHLNSGMSSKRQRKRDRPAVACKSVAKKLEGALSRGLRGR
jgi:large subunit ribosomal protein L35